ncbi:MAG: glycoside hydrolase family 28 protein [Sphaerochaetaceae bacterium]
MIYYPKASGSVLEDTRGIQDAIDAASRQGGGTIFLSAGQSYCCGTLILKNHITLHLENGARLVASPNLEDFRQGGAVDTDETREVGTPVLRKPAFAFLYAYDAESVVISGEGTIDGNCYQFVKRVSPYHYAGDFYPRVTLIYTEKCNKLSVRGITLVDSPFWSLHMAGCSNVLVEGITIMNPLDVANSDGIDPDHCTNVRIIGCHISCADDCICLKNTEGNKDYPPTKGIIISDCTLTSTSAAIKIGTEGVDDFSDILVHHCIISRSNRGISIQVRDQGSVRNVHFSDILIETRLFSDEYWGKAECIAITSFNRNTKITSGTISDVYFNRIFTHGESGVFIASDGEKIRNIGFDDVSVHLEKTSKWPLCGYDLRPRQAKPFLLDRPVSAFFVHMAKEVQFSRVKAKIAQRQISDGVLVSEHATIQGEVQDAS